MEYWNDIITEKSWSLLQKIRKKFDFILIGGWAVYLWTKALKSRDIDIIIDFDTLNKLKTEYDLRKNENLKKYELKIDEVDIDIYIPFYSELALPINILKKKISTIQGFKVVNPEFLLILKQKVELERSHSEKGEKDRIDILSLVLNIDINFKEYYKLLKENNLISYSERLIKIIKNFKDYNYFNLNPREYKLKKEKIIKNIK